MRLISIWNAVIVLVLAVVLGPDCRFASGEEPQKKDSPEPKLADPEKSLKQALLEDARKVFEMNLARYQAGNGGLDVEAMSSWSTRWLEAEIDVAADATAKTSAFKAHLSRMKEVEKSATALAKTGQGREADALAARFFRNQAEIWLARGRTK
jgi:hypothetical protein